MKTKPWRAWSPGEDALILLWAGWTLEGKLTVREAGRRLHRWMPERCLPSILDHLGRAREDILEERARLNRWKEEIAS